MAILYLPFIISPSFFTYPVINPSPFGSTMTSMSKPWPCPLTLNRTGFPLFVVRGAFGSGTLCVTGAVVFPEPV